MIYEHGDGSQPTLLAHERTAQLVNAPVFRLLRERNDELGIHNLSQVSNRCGKVGRMARTDAVLQEWLRRGHSVLEGGTSTLWTIHKAGGEWYGMCCLCVARVVDLKASGRQDPAVSHFMKIQCNAHLRDLSLAREHDNYKLMQGCVCNLAQIIDYGEEGPWTFLVVTDLEVDLGRFYRASRSLEFYMVGQIVLGMVGLPAVCSLL